MSEALIIGQGHFDVPHNGRDLGRIVKAVTFEATILGSFVELALGYLGKTVTLLTFVDSYDGPYTGTQSAGTMAGVAGNPLMSGSVRQNLRWSGQRDRKQRK